MKKLTMGIIISAVIVMVIVGQPYKQPADVHQQEITMEQPAVLSAEPMYYDIPLSCDEQDHLFSEAEKNSVPVPLMLAMIECESGFDSSEVSQTNDYGLMQINEVNHEWLQEELGITDFLDPKQSITCGAYMIGSLLNKYGDTQKALMGYNMGETGARKLWKQGISTSAYSRSVMAAMIKYEKEDERNVSQNIAGLHVDV